MRLTPMTDLLPCINPTLPAVYSKALSYLDAIAELQGKINEIVEEINNIDEINKAYVDQQIELLRNYVNNQIALLNTDINNLADKESKDIQNVYLEISRVYSNLVNLINVLNTSMRYELINYINERFDQVGKSFEVVNPVNGLRTSIQRALDSLYTNLRYMAFTAVEYDQLGLTAQQYDDLSVSAYHYDQYGPFKAEQRFSMMIDPFTGLYVDMRVVINQLVSLHKQALTASGYDDKNLTATTYDALALTAYLYDFEGELHIP